MNLFIFRRDFRTFDNRAFDLATKNPTIPTIPIFIFNDIQTCKKLNAYRSPRALSFMIEALLELKLNLKELTFYKCRDPEDEIELLKRILNETPSIKNIYFNADVTPFARARDANTIAFAEKRGIKVIACTDEYSLVDPTTMEKPYRKFTPFYNKYISTLRLEPLKSSDKKFKRGPAVLDHACTDADMREMCPDSIIDKNKRPRSEALEILNRITDGSFDDYSTTRDDMGDSDGTTKLSHYIKFGCIGVREVARTLPRDHGILRELLWRSFYEQVAYHFPNVLKGQTSAEDNKSLVVKFDNVKWLGGSTASQRFDAFANGRTGFDLVDAAIMELLNTGRMHNRGRMLTASFLVKTLRLDWRLGEQFFARHLIDYDPCSNNGGWQWAAGGGADSQMYTRIFSPYRQAEKHDPKGLYVNKWLAMRSRYEPIVDMKKEHALTKKAFYDAFFKNDN